MKIPTRLPHHWSAWVTGLMFVAFWIIVNLPQPARIISSFGGTTYLDGELNVEAIPSPEITTGGWPIRYYWKQDFPEPLPDSWGWSNSAFAIDILIAVMITLAAVGMIMYRSRRGGDHVGAKRRITIAELLGVTALIALGFGFYQVHRRHFAREVAIVQGLDDASFKIQATVPAYFHDWTWKRFWHPDLVQSFSRVTELRMQHPSDTDIAAAMQLSSLRRLSIGGGDYDLEGLAALPNMHTLNVLQLTGRTLDDATIARLSHMQNLRLLDLSRTNVTGETLQKMFSQDTAEAPRLARLEQLSMIDSAVTLKSFSELDLLSRLPNLHTLTLTRPVAGETDTFTLSSHPTLIKLGLYSLDRVLNPTPIDVTLRNLPALEILEVDATQKCSLKLSSLPKLTSISRVAHQQIARVASGQSVPGALWVDRIEIDDLPALPQLTLYAGDVSYYRTAKTPRLKMLGIGVYRFGFLPGQRTPSSMYDPSVPAQATAALVRGIGESDGPELLDFSSVPLGDADLQPLFDNSRLQRLLLHHCKLKVKDYQSLDGNPNLAQVSSLGVIIDGKDLGDLVGSMPALQRWHGELISLNRLRLENHVSVRGIVDCDPTEGEPRRCHLPTCDALRLINLPQWTDPIRLDHPSMRHLTLDGLPRLTALIINTPLADDAVLHDLPGLEILAAGGKRFDDDRVDAIGDLPNLRDLRLIGTSVTPAGYRKILATSRMQSLDLSGEQVDDDAITAINTELLGAVRLDRTQITDRGVRHLLQAPQLNRLSIAGVAIENDTLERISLLQTCPSVTINAASITPIQLNRMCMSEFIQELGLSDFHLDLAAAAAMSSGGRSPLRNLSLIDCTVDEPALARLLSELPMLKLTLERTEIPALIEADLFASERLQNRDAGDGPYIRLGEFGQLPIGQIDLSRMWSFGSQEKAPAMSESIFHKLTPSHFVSTNDETLSYFPMMIQSTHKSMLEHDE